MKNKKWVRVLGIILSVLLVLGIIKNGLLKQIITITASSVTGTKVKIEKFSFGVFKHSIRIRGFKMYHPKGFEKGVMVDVPEISVDYKFLPLLKGRIEVPLVVFDLKELVIVKDKNGNLNVDALKVAQGEEGDLEKKDGATKKKKKKKKKSKKAAMQIDEVILNLGQVVVKDYTVGEKPSVVAHEIGIKDKVYKNISSAQELAALIMVQAMGPAAMTGAKIYAAAAILGVGFLPAGIAGVLIAKDSGVREFNSELTKVYEAVLKTIQESGELKSENRESGIIKAKIDGADIAIVLRVIEEQKTEVTVSARKMMLPKPKIANGILYQISEIVK